ncbi:hypothetical protein CAOG_08774 [Capsaspora owczarzaki ATCC 30864]|uniref:NOD3 protein n=1 Tax=Capsaspora owczarzaki (strain ATCC 30864) TaxID=595528 RepID=A0A0D2X320_CAPO3|nr:hypothetical protein CAOG_08774 [Capsaspora owczarzaki ATCC 30864]KJE93544.1 hypothetical protein CAOG_008774 [Capsaspora owczarzaki ATCC 30864]|eukprot:XP_011270404.1 hypothetical protein CAOG_08774 [Capsaspora owczarzaki ATCC 30864]
MSESQRKLYDRVTDTSEWLLWDGKQIGNDGAQAVAEALKVSRTLVSIELGQNHISDVGARAIAETLKVNKTVAEVTLRQNQIGDAGAQAFAEALKVNTNLRWLNLSSTQLGDAGARAIAETLKVNTTLKYLYLNRNQIGDAGAQSIAEALKVNTTLIDLHLHTNRIGDAGAQAIAAALGENKTMTELHLWNNCIGQVGVQALGEARKVNGILTRLIIEDQINPLAFSLLPRLATTEDWQSVFHLLTGRHEKENQPAPLPALPAEIAELVMDKAEYLQGVQHIHQAWAKDHYVDFLKLTMPRSSNGNSIRVKAIQVLRERQSEATSDPFDLIVRDELGAVRYEWAAEAPVVDSTIQLVTISPTDHPVIRQLRAGWEVEVQFGIQIGANAKRRFVSKTLKKGPVTVSGYPF